MMKPLTIQEKLNQALIDSGLSKEDIMELRANSSFDLLVKAEKPYMSKKSYDNELSYLQYDGKYFLLYVIKADIPETGKNAFIGGNIVVAIGKKPMEHDEIQAYYDKGTITQDEFYAPFVFPSLLWRKGYVSTIGKYNSMFEKCCFYLSTIGKYDDYYGERVSVDEKSYIGVFGVSTLSGVAVKLATIEQLWRRYNYPQDNIHTQNKIYHKHPKTNTDKSATTKSSKKQKRNQNTNQFDKDYILLEDMTYDEYYPKHLVDKIKQAILQLIELLESGTKDETTIQSKLDDITLFINSLLKQFDENGSEIDTIARESIAETIEYILKWFNINIDTEKAIRYRDW